MLGARLQVLTAIVEMDGQAWAGTIKKRSGIEDIRKPIKRLLRDRLITARWVTVNTARGNRKRRMYRATRAGVSALDDAVAVVRGGRNDA